MQRILILFISDLKSNPKHFANMRGTTHAIAVSKIHRYLWRKLKIMANAWPNTHSIFCSKSDRVIKRMSKSSPIVIDLMKLEKIENHCIKIYKFVILCFSKY